MMSGQYPRLSNELARQLAAIPASDDLYRPCKVVLKDGAVLDRIYVVDALPYVQIWGIWPEDDRGKRSLDLNTVAQITESPSRLPVEFADILYREGESGMGYTVFTVCFRDGSSLAVMAGNAVDFIEYPEGQSPETVTSVLPHVGRDDPRLTEAPRYSWCLYEELAVSDRGFSV